MKTNFKDKNRFETIREYLNRKSAEREQNQKNLITLAGILILLSGIFIGLLR